MDKLTASAELKQKMRRHIQDNCLLTGKDFALSSGAASSYYFDCKKATLDGEFLANFAAYVCGHVVPGLDEQPDSVGGLTLGADFITAAIAMHSAKNGGVITQGSIVRKEPKKHGTKSKIENELSDSKILVVEDVITSGASIAKACDEFIASGYKPLAMLSIIDREAGGIKMLEDKYGIEVIKIFSSSDFSLS